MTTNKHRPDVLQKIIMKFNILIYLFNELQAYQLIMLNSVTFSKNIIKNKKFKTDLFIQSYPHTSKKFKNRSINLT